MGYQTPLQVPVHKGSAGWSGFYQTLYLCNRSRYFHIKIAFIVPKGKTGRQVSIRACNMDG